MRDIGFHRGAHGVRLRFRIVEADDVDLVLEIDEAVPKPGRMNQREADLGNTDLFHLESPFREPLSMSLCPATRHVEPPRNISWRSRSRGVRGDSLDDGPLTGARA